MKTARLGDHASFLSGFAFKSNLFNESGQGMPVIRIRDVLRGYSDTFYSGNYDERYLVHQGEYLIGMDGEFNLARWQSGPALLNQRVCKIDGLSKDLDRHYLAKFLPAILKKIEDETPFVTVKHLSVKKLNEAKIPLPPLAEQKRIAAILDAADILRIKRRESLAQLDTLLQSTFLDMFGDPMTNPMGWEDNRKLGDVADIVSGITIGRKVNPQENLREVPYLAVMNVQDRHIKLDTVKLVAATESEIKRYSLKPDDLLLTEGGDPDKLGRGSLWRNELDECIHQNHVFRVRLTSQDVYPVFLNWLVGSARGKQYFFRSAKQTTGIASINMTQLKAFPMLLPPLDLQRRFGSIFDCIELQKSRLREHLSELDTLFASLQQRAFSGDL